MSDLTDQQVAQFDDIVLTHYPEDDGTTFRAEILALREAGWEIKPPPEPEPVPTYPGTDREVQVGDVVKCRYCDDYEFTDVPYHLITEVVGDEDARTALADDQFKYSLLTEVEELTFIGRPGEAAKVGDKVLVVGQSASPCGEGVEVGEVAKVESVCGGALLNGRPYGPHRYVIVERAPEVCGHKPLDENGIPGALTCQRESHDDMHHGSPIKGEDTHYAYWITTGAAIRSNSDRGWGFPCVEPRFYVKRFGPPEVGVWQAYERNARGDGVDRGVAQFNETDDPSAGQQADEYVVARNAEVSA